MLKKHLKFEVTDYSRFNLVDCHWLIVYVKSMSKLVVLKPFIVSDEAYWHRKKFEKLFRGNTNVEIVVLCDTLENIRIGHPRYFSAQRVYSVVK